MAKWKVAGHLAMAMREAERQMAEKRLQEEQRAESLKNATLLRSLKRSRDGIGQKGRTCAVKNERWYRTLYRETEEARKNVEVASCAAYQKEDKKNQDEVISNIQLMDSRVGKFRETEAELEMVRLKEKEMDREIRDCREKLRLWRLGKGQVHPRPRITGPEHVEARIQLQKEMMGKQLAENRWLAEEINHLRRQRDHVVLIHCQLKQELDELSKQLTDHVEEAQTTYEQRDLNLRNMSKLTEHMSKSTTAHHNDIQTLQFKIDVCKRMEEFMMTKNKFRQDEGKERRRESRKQKSQMEREVQMLGELLRQVKSDLNEEDTRVIVTTFVQLQTENYMLFKNISHVRDGCHQLQVELDTMREKVDKTKSGQHTERQENNERQQELMEKIDICRQAANKKEIEVHVAHEVITTYIRAVTDILTSMGYSPQAIISLAGIFGKMEERNISTFLAEIERYVNRLHRLNMTVEFGYWMTARRSSFTAIPAEPLPPREATVPRIVVLPPQITGEWVAQDNDDSSDIAVAEQVIWPADINELRKQVEEELIGIRSEAMTPEEDLPIDGPISDPISERKLAINPPTVQH